MKNIFLEILFDILTELHSILRTTLPDVWVFVKLKNNKDLSIILNNMTYFTAYIAFLAWFITVLISRVQDASRNRLQAKDKYLIAVTSMVSATHVLWPFLLSFTYFFTCSFYPWTTSIVVILLNLCFIKSSLRLPCFNVSTRTSDFKNRIGRISSFEWLAKFREIQAATKQVIAPAFNTVSNILSSEEDDRGPSATPVIQPRLTVEEEYRSTETPAIEPRIKSDKHRGPSQAPVIQPRITAKESHRPSDTPRIQLEVKPKMSYGTSETPVIQPRMDSTAVSKTTQTTNIQHHADHRSPLKGPKSVRMQPQSEKKSYKPSRTPRKQPGLKPEISHGTSETPVIRPRMDSTAVNKSTQTSNMQHCVDHRSPFKGPKSVRMQPQGEKKSYKPSQTPRKQPRNLEFDTIREDTGHHEEFSYDSRVGTSGNSRGFFMSDEKSSRMLEDYEVRKKSEFGKVKNQIDGTITNKDLPQQVDLSNRLIGTSSPSRGREINPNEYRLGPVGGYQVLHGDHKIGYCGRCWKVNNLAFRAGFTTLREPRTTRLGTVYGPPRYFSTIHQFIIDYGKRIPKWISSKLDFDLR